MQINKSDRNDADSIARIMEPGWFKEVSYRQGPRQQRGQSAAGGPGQALELRLLKKYDSEWGETKHEDPRI